jgi:hypothetical protein
VRPLKVETEALMGRFDQKVFASMVVNRDWAVTRAPVVLVSRVPPGLSFRVLLAEAAGYRIVWGHAFPPCFLPRYELPRYELPW